MYKQCAPPGWKPSGNLGDWAETLPTILLSTTHHRILQMSESPKERAAMQDWSVYILVQQGKQRTYIGATTNPHRRLRQHNGEIVGGARSTRGKKWQLVLWISGFRDRRECYRWEKLVKLRTRGLNDRLWTLVQLTHGNFRKPGKKYEVPKDLLLNIELPEHLKWKD
jgi:predicted GIY-YIG superfamily endonuclease